MHLSDLLGFPLTEAERRIREAGLDYRVQVSKAPRDAESPDISNLRVVRARWAEQSVVLTVVQPPTLELPE